MGGRGDWSTSDRLHRLPPDWPHRRRLVLARDPICRACARAPSSDVDHVIPGDDHDPSNLAGLCAPCHASKTAAEGAAGRARVRDAGRYPTEPHPGG